MIKLKELLTESKDSKYYDFQIKIPGENSWDNDDIVYYSTGGKLQKHTTSRDDNPLVLNVKLRLDEFKQDLSLWKEKLNYIKKLNY